MNNIIAFLGSPRPHGYTNRLIEKVLEGAKSAGATTTVYRLNDTDIKGCQGCFYCRTHEGCATKDKLQPMYEDIKNATGIVAGFPIYFGSVSGQAKLWLDRMYPMLGDNFVPRYPGKKVVTVYAQANADRTLFSDAIKSTDDFFRLCGFTLLDSLHVYGNTAPGYTISQEMFDKAFEAGRKLTENGRC